MQKPGDRSPVLSFGSMSSRLNSAQLSIFSAAPSNGSFSSWVMRNVPGTWWTVLIVAALVLAFAAFMAVGGYHRHRTRGLYSPGALAIGVFIVVVLFGSLLVPN